jgi:hypothetical protein
MIRSLFYRVLLVVLTVLGLARGATAAEPDLGALCRQFEQYSGAEIVFDRADLPSGRYYDVLEPLSASMKAEAAAVCLGEARKYPPGYFGEVGLKAVGVFAACVSKTGDRFRAYDNRLKGYRYFGIYNGIDAVAAAYYDNPQLPMTFHHEIFHHVDSTHRGTTESWQLSSDDAVFKAALSGLEPHAAPAIAADDLAALRGRCKGYLLRDAVSPYAARNSREDQAETARHLMLNLPDALVQAIEQPELPGSQRILHVLGEYEQSVLDGPGFDWFVDVALQRTPAAVDPLLARLKAYAHGGGPGFGGVADDPGGARTTLQAIGRLDAAEIPAQKAAEVVRLASKVTQTLLTERIRPDRQQQRFAVWGPEDAAGVNWTLRKDVKQFGTDAVRLKRIAAFDKRQSDLLARTQMKNLRLITRYYAYLASNWSITPGTRQVFESARDTLSGSLPTAQASLTKSLQATELRELAWRIAEDGQPRLLPRPSSD